MPSADKIHEALGLLLKHCDEQHPYMAAEHDVVYLPGPEPSKLPPEVAKRLEELGMFYDETLPSWQCFV